MLPNSKKNANQVSQVNGIASTGNNVFKLQMPAIGPKVIAITINAGLGTNGPALGRQVSSAIRQYGKVSTRATF